MVLAQASGLMAVTLYLTTGLKKKEHIVRQQLREFYDEAAAKRGAGRQALDVTANFADLLAWVLARWAGRHLALALDATNLGQRFTVLVVRVVSRGCAIPVAWQVLPMLKKEEWRPHWLRLLRQVRRADDVIVHLRLRGDGKVLIEYDVIEYGIAHDLIEAGIAKKMTSC